MRSTKSATLVGLGALALSLGIGCGGDGRAEKLAAARERVDAAEERLVAAKAMRDERQEAFDEAEKALEAAEERVAEVESELEAARKAVSEHSSDATIFRQVQQRLLDAADLQGVAISASVREGVVTLSGEVPSEALRERAVEVAKGTPGVAEVKSGEIRVREKSEEGEESGEGV